MCGGGGDGSASDAPLSLAATIFSGRFAVRLTIAGNYLPLPPRARRDSTTRALLAVALWRHHRLAPDPLSPFLLPRFLASTARAARRSKTSGIIVDRRRPRVSFVFCFIALRPLRSFVYVAYVYVRVYTHTRRTRARAFPHVQYTYVRWFPREPPRGHPRRTRKGRESTRGRSLRFGSSHEATVLLSRSAFSLPRSRGEREIVVGAAGSLPTPRASTRKRSTTYRSAGSRRLYIAGDNTATTTSAFIA